MQEYFQVRSTEQPENGVNESMGNESMGNDESMGNEVNEVADVSMNNTGSSMNDEQLSCQAALQTAMDKCGAKQEPEPETSAYPVEDEPETSASPEDPVEVETETTSSPEEVTSEPFIEGFENPTQLWQPNVKLLLNVLIMMCVFYLLSHFETGKYLSTLAKGLKGRNLHLLLTLLFGLVYLLLKQYL